MLKNVLAVIGLVVVVKHAGKFGMQLFQDQIELNARRNLDKKP